MSELSGILARCFFSCGVNGLQLFECFVNVYDGGEQKYIADVGVNGGRV